MKFLSSECTEHTAGCTVEVHTECGSLSPTYTPRSVRRGKEIAAWDFLSSSQCTVNTAGCGGQYRVWKSKSSFHTQVNFEWKEIEAWNFHPLVNAMYSTHCWVRGSIQIQVNQEGKEIAAWDFYSLTNLLVHILLDEGGQYTPRLVRKWTEIAARYFSHLRLT